MKLTKIQAAQIWLCIFSELYDRKGFEEWWDSLDQEIVDEISLAVEKRLEELEL